MFWIVSDCYPLLLITAQGPRYSPRYRLVLTALVECGLARRAISPADGIFRYGPVKMECAHERMTCKDCGAEIAKDSVGKSPEGGPSKPTLIPPNWSKLHSFLDTCCRERTENSCLHFLSDEKEVPAGGMDLAIKGEAIEALTTTLTPALRRAVP